MRPQCAWNEGKFEGVIVGDDGCIFSNHCGLINPMRPQILSMLITEPPQTYMGNFLQLNFEI